MVDKLKEKIKLMKKEKNGIKEYISCFCDNKKNQDLFKENSEFRRIRESNKKESFD